jgi:hypothetical protein
MTVRAQTQLKSELPKAKIIVKTLFRSFTSNHFDISLEQSIMNIKKNGHVKSHHLLHNNSKLSFQVHQISLY